MAGRTITRAEISEAIYQEVGLSRNESTELVAAVLKEMADALVRGIRLYFIKHPPGPKSRLALLG